MTLLSSVYSTAKVWKLIEETATMIYGNANVLAFGDDCD